ncbi:hypothetical protein ABPG72_010882 [Tetrahymena utriculariae]
MNQIPYLKITKSFNSMGKQGVSDLGFSLAKCPLLLDLDLNLSLKIQFTLILLCEQLLNNKQKQSLLIFYFTINEQKTELKMKIRCIRIRSSFSKV